MPEDRPLSLRVRWTAPLPGVSEPYLRFLRDSGLTNLNDLQTEFGMQRGRQQLVPGSPQPDGSTVFEVSVLPYRDKAGRQRFRGDVVQGPPGEPFLYLSWRVSGAKTWIARAKIGLDPLTDNFFAGVPDATVLETDVPRFGHRGRGHVQEWRPVQAIG